MDQVVVERFDDGIVVLTLNRPERRNASSPRLLAESFAAFREGRAAQWQPL